jgi:hypothetical protein
MRMKNVGITAVTALGIIAVGNGMQYWLESSDLSSENEAKRCSVAKNNLDYWKRECNVIEQIIGCYGAIKANEHYLENHCQE